MKKRKLIEKTRITLDLSPQFYERLQGLQNLVEANSQSDVVRQALQLYEYMAKKTSAGFKFRQVTPQGEEENIVFFDLPDSNGG